MMVALRRERGMRREEIEHLFRHEGGRVLATLIRLVGDFELAEEVLQEAFAAALEQWSTVPDNPRAWLVNVGRHKAIDRIRRQMRLRAKRPYLEAEAALAGDVLPLEPDGDSLGDDMLRLIFICCHPALNMETRVALTLRAVCGLTTEAVARAFLVSEDAMAQRLVRAKAKIRGARIPYQTPDPERLDERLEGVLAVIYLVFSEGYAGTSGETLTREDVSREAIRLGRLLDELLPGRGGDRRASWRSCCCMMRAGRRGRARRAISSCLRIRIAASGISAQIGEGLELVERALRAPGRPSSYSVQAAIAALHARARRHGDTDWPQIVGLYEVLMRLAPSPVVELNHAAAIAMVDGPARALDLIDALIARGELGDYHLLPAVRGNLLNRLGRREEARGLTPKHLRSPSSNRNGADAAPAC